MLLKIWEQQTPIALKDAIKGLLDMSREWAYRSWDTFVQLESVNLNEANEFVVLAEMSNDYRSNPSEMTCI